MNDLDDLQREKIIEIATISSRLRGKFEVLKNKTVYLKTCAEVADDQWRQKLQSYKPAAPQLQCSYDNTKEKLLAIEKILNAFLASTKKIIS